MTRKPDIHDYRALLAMLHPEGESYKRYERLLRELEKLGGIHMILSGKEIQKQVIGRNIVEIKKRGSVLDDPRAVSALSFEPGD